MNQGVTDSFSFCVCWGKRTCVYVCMWACVEARCQVSLKLSSLPVQNSQHDLKHVLYWAHDLEKQQQHTVQPGEGFGNKNTPCEIYLEGNFRFNGKI